MLIRVEIPVDAARIDQLLCRSFPTDMEAKLVHQLRENGLLTLGMVATDDEGNVFGYTAFSPAYIAGEDRQWVVLAPIAVERTHRRQGLAEQLIYAGLDTLNEFGYAAVVVIGDPAYYRRLGFISALDKGLHCCWPGTEQVFQVYGLADGEWENCRGSVKFSIPFNCLD